MLTGFLDNLDFLFVLIHWQTPRALEREVQEAPAWGRHSWPIWEWSASKLCRITAGLLVQISCFSKVTDGTVTYQTVWLFTQKHEREWWRYFYLQHWDVRGQADAQLELVVLQFFLVQGQRAAWTPVGSVCVCWAPTEPRGFIIKCMLSSVWRQFVSVSLLFHPVYYIHVLHSPFCDASAARLFKAHQCQAFLPLVLKEYP